MLALLLASAVVVAACDSAGSETISTVEAGPGTPPTVGGQPDPVGASSTTGVGPTGTGDGLVCWSAAAATGTTGITFSDVTEAVGLHSPLIGMHAHAAAWGDLNDDGAVDLFVGTFADRSPEKYQERGAVAAAPDRVLLAQDAGFIDGELPEAYGRTSGAVFVDLDSDGDLDLVLSRNVKESPRGGIAAGTLPTAVYENVAGGLVERQESGIDPALGGRSVGVLDYDGDRRYDLFIVEDRYQGGSSRLYRNMGDFQFEDVTAEAGLLMDIHGLGVATADVDGDGDVDLFVAGSNQLFVAAEGGFRAANSAVFAWPPVGAEDDVAGAAFGDVDRDGRPDLVIGHHFGSTLNGGPPAPVRLFLNRTVDVNQPAFVEVTEGAGLTALPTKAPHVEIVDFDNDGWPDILTSASAGDGATPAIFRNEGAGGGSIHFEAPEGIGAPQYWVTAPTADYDRDGRLDVMLVEWEPALPSILLRNESESGSWLAVSVGVELGHGLGGRVIAYQAGGLGQADMVLGSAEITVSRGYAAGVEAIAHLGLGDVDTVDLEIVTPWGDPIGLTGVAANQAIRVPSGCPSGP